AAAAATAAAGAARAPPGLRARGHGRREAAGHGRLALLVGRHALAVDARLARLLVASRDGAGAGDGVARPHPGREAHLVAAQVPGPDEVGQAARDEARREHPVAEHGRVAGGAGERLVVVDRVEVTGRARVAHQIGAVEVLDHDGRDGGALGEAIAHAITP